MEVRVYRIMFILLAVIGTSLMGIGVTAVLTAGLPGWKPIVMAAAAGLLLSVPMSWYVAKRIVGAGIV